MPFFKSTYNILKKFDEDEVFNINWMDSDKLILPPSAPWDYKREMQIEDVDIWEVLYEESGGRGVYASWNPYAEFYMITSGWKNMFDPDKIIETYYGNGAVRKVFNRSLELGIPLNIQKVWVDEEDMWLYE